MSVDRDEVRRIAELARLDLDDAEADRLTEDMNRILEHAERLRGLDADEAAPGAAAEAAGGASEATDGPRGAAEAVSDDAIGPDPLLRPPRAFAPELIEGFFAVPPPPGVVADDSEDDGSPEAGQDRGAEGREEEDE